MECCGYGVINTENCARRKNSGDFKSSNFDFFLIVIKIFSGFDWLKVFLGSVIQELLSFPPLFLYLCVYRIYTGEWHGLNDMYAPLGWYVVIGSALTLVAIYIYKYFVEIIFGNYAKWELKQRGCIGDLSLLWS